MPYAVSKIYFDPPPSDGGRQTVVARVTRDGVVVGALTVHLELGRLIPVPASWDATGLDATALPADADLRADVLVSLIMDAADQASAAAYP